MSRSSGSSPCVGILSLFLLSTAVAVAPHDTLVVQESSDIPTIDPGTTYDSGSGQIVENIYETLLGYQGSNLKVLTPRLATSWKLSNNERIYTFNLRAGVRFHSGNAFTCSDAQYTIQRNLITNSGESGNWFLSESILGTPENAADDPTITWKRIEDAVKCNSSGQLILTLPKADPAFLAKLASVGQSIVDRRWAIKLGEWDGTGKTWKSWVGKDLKESTLNQQPSGTGAYKLVRRDANAILLTAFDGYWGKRGNIKNVIVQKVPELAARAQAFLKGDADVIEGAERTADEKAFKGQPGVTWLDDLPNLAAPTIFMNQDIKDTKILGSGTLDGNGIPANFFKDANVRIAFSYAFGYSQYIQEVENGRGTIRTMLLPDSFPGYDPKLPTYSFNLAKAASAFQKAWGGKVWNKGFVLTANFSDQNKDSQVIMEILKKNIEAINPKFRINLVPKQWSDLLSDNKKGRLALAVGAWTPDYADPDNFMYTFYSSKGYYFPRTGWKNAQVDAWLEEARQTTSSKIRNQRYSLVGNVAYREAPYIIVPASVNYLFFRDVLKGVDKSTYNPIVSFGLGVHWKDLQKD